MGNDSVFSRIKAFLSKSAGDGLQVLGRSNQTQDQTAGARKPGPTRAAREGELADEDLPSAEQRDGLRMIAQPDGQDVHLNAGPDRVSQVGDEIEDQELPSVNRRGGKGKMPSILMVLTFGMFAFLVFAMTSGNAPPVPPPSSSSIPGSTPAAPQQAAVVNSLPPLVMPSSPEPLTAPAGEVQIIPLQSGQPGGASPAQQVAALEEPEWMTRKVTSDVMLDPAKVKTKDLGASTPAAEPQSAAKAASRGADDAAGSQGELSQNLKSLVVTEGARAGILPNRNFLIAKGTLLDCALETAIDSSLAGLVTCRLTRDVYSDNGRVIMLDRGSQLVGEYKSGIAEGMVRIFVLWTRAKTPKGVVISLNSPGTDALGRTGLEGFVDTHFMERFGAAIMMSAVQMGFDYAKTEAQAKSTASTTNISSTSSSGGGNSILDKIATEQLKKSVSIPPVLYINQGANVQVMVVRDLDFASVYNVEEKE